MSNSYKLMSTNYHELTLYITGNVSFKSFTLPVAQGDQELLSLLSSLSASCTQRIYPLRSIEIIDL